MIKLRIIAAALLTLSGSVMFAQTESSLLWKVSGNDIKESYLFGTIHLLCQDDLMLPDALKESLKASEQLVLELDFDDPSMMAEVQKYMNMEEGTLKDLFTEEEYASVKSFFLDRMGLPLEAMPKIKPFMLMSMMIPVLMECPPASYETSLVELAKANGQEVIGLETVEEQMAAVDGLPADTMADMLVEQVENYEDAREDFAAMVAAYKKQDPDALLAEMESQMDEVDMESFNRVMLVERNHNWIGRIEKIAGEKSSFFAVGAGHLGGPDGVITLLRNAGYTVTPIK